MPTLPFLTQRRSRTNLTPEPQPTNPTSSPQMPTRRIPSEPHSLAQRERPFSMATDHFPSPTQRPLNRSLSNVPSHRMTVDFQSQMPQNSPPMHTHFQGRQPPSGLRISTIQPDTMLQASPVAMSAPVDFSGQGGMGSVRSLPSMIHSPVMQKMDEVVVQMQVSQAVMDASGFEILPMEEVEELKKDYTMLSSRTAALTNQLSIENKIREAAVSLTQLHANNRKLLKQANEQLAAANRKVEQVTTELARLSQREVEVERKLMQHAAGVLSMGVRRLEEQVRSGGFSGSPAGAGFMDAGVQQDTNDLKQKIKYLNNLIVHLQSSVTESQQLLKTRDHEIEDLKMQLKYSHDPGSDEKERLIAELRAELEDVSSQLDMLHRGDTDKEDEELKMENSSRLMELQSTLTLLESDLSGAHNRIHELEEELARERDKATIAAAQAPTEDTKFEIERVQAEAEFERRQRTELQSRILDLERELASARREQHPAAALRDSSGVDIEALRTRLFDAEEERDMLSNQYHSMSDTLRSLYAELPDNPAENSINGEDSFNMDALVSRIRRQVEENHRLMDRVMELHSSAEEVEEKQQRMRQEHEHLKAQLERQQSEHTAILASRVAELDATKNQVTGLETRLSQLQGELNTSRQKEKEMSAEMEKLREEMAQVDRERHQLQEALAGAAAQMSEGESALEQRFAELERGLRAQISDRERDIKQYETELEEARRQLTEKSEECERLRDQTQELEVAVAEKSRTLEELQDQSARLHEELEDTKRQHQELSDEHAAAIATASASGIAKTQQDLAQAHKQIAQLKEEIEGLRQDLSVEQDQQKTLRSTLQVAQREFSAREQILEKRSETLREELDCVQREFDRLMSKLTDFDEERDELEDQVRHLKVKVRELETQLNEERVKRVPSGDGQAEAKKLMEELRREYSAALEREAEEKQKLELALRQAKRQREMSMLTDKETKGVQTTFISG
ncbi:uncharacterized protein VTP21DRAFT_8296 [Calcarisporiella thermophila]|uniref:uncharacterized protein n=1 Tax=Calcarisporiella thermophila TaxID=911321 RepID=UPI003742AE57